MNITEKLIKMKITIFEHELQMTKIASGLNNPNIIHLIGHGSGTLVEREQFIIELII